LCDNALDKWDVDELIGLLKHEFWQVRDEAAFGLGKLKNPRAIEPLLLMLTNSTDACAAAIHALKVLAPERLREPLLVLLRQPRPIGWAVAAGVLADFQEPLALPILVDLVKDTSPEHKHSCDIAGRFLAQFGNDGFDAIAGLLTNENPLVRLRAAIAILNTRDPRAIDHLQALAIDDDENVRETGAFGVKFLSNR